MITAAIIAFAILALSWLLAPGEAGDGVTAPMREEALAEAA